MFFRASEAQLQTELDFARSVGAQNRASASDVDPILRKGEVRCVEKVEELCAELDVHPLSHLEILEHREIHIVRGGASQASPAGIAEESGILNYPIHHGVGRQVKSTRIEPGRERVNFVGRASPLR